MSNFLAVATVTAALRQFLGPMVAAAVPGATVTTLRPDASNAATTQASVNLFLYQVTPNGATRNDNLPSRRADGQVVQRPRVALNLNYLFTFHGDETQLEPQRMLGSVVSSLYATPVLTRDVIQKTITNPTFAPFLATSDLADAIEQVKFTPVELAIEELSKLWSVFLQTPYSLSVVYQGTLVSIESGDVPQAALPVHARNLYAMPFRQPVVQQILAQTGPAQPIVAGTTLVILGHELSSDAITVRIGGQDIAIDRTAATDTQISLPLPTGLLAGVQALQVIQPLSIGTPPARHRGFESNVAAFVLQPTITVSAAPVSSRVVNGATLATDDVTITFTPPVGKNQRVSLLLNEYNPLATRVPWAYSFTAPARDQTGGPDASPSLTIRVTDVAPVTYLARVQVDGAESPLISDASGQFASPQVKIS
jgi:hypothetical protein